MDSKLKKARKASGMTNEAVCAILGVSYPTYNAYERDPSKMPIDYYMRLKAEMDEDAQALMLGVLDDVADKAQGMKLRKKLTLGDLFGVMSQGEGIVREIAG